MDLVNGGKETNKQTPCIRVLTKNKNFFNSPEHLIRCKEFNLEYDGGFHFSIDQKLWVNNLFLGLAIFGIFMKNLSPLFELQE